jgi:integrase
LIFTTDRGQAIRPEAYRRQFRALLKRAGIKAEDLVPHSLRHTTGSYLEEAGVPLGTISDLLGHTDMTMLVERYRHRTTSKVTGHVDAMKGILDSKAGKGAVEKSSNKSSNAHSTFAGEVRHE